MFSLINKSILIISPQKWGKMHISKHHYSIELAKRGNFVYFLNPPLRKFFPKISILKDENIENLFIISYSYFFPYNLKFHLRNLFDKLQAVNIKFIKKKINKELDIVWCFDTNLFSDLSIFNSKIKIYHPVDNISGKNQIQLLKTADFVFSLSDVIIKDLHKFDSNKKIYFINHGLTKYFINENQNINLFDKKKQLLAYFLGNVLLSSLDHNITKKVILQNPNINFVFVGAYNQSNISGNPDTNSINFISFLKEQKNVILKGALHPKDAVIELQKADVLLVLIDPQKDINQGSNSHKILEYLSIGKVIVSNHISTYADKRELFEMVDELHNEKLPALFQKVITNLEYYNSPELQKKRIEYALDNTYQKQIERIEKIISENYEKS